jgi:hypothetical protein
VHRKDFIEVNQVAQEKREGIFQNWSGQKWEYWEGGEKQGDIAFTSIPGRDSLEAWLASLDRDSDA